jgi:hypothetical protein
MRAITLSTASGAQAGLAGDVELMGVELEHTAAVNGVVQMTNSSGQVLTRLRTSGAGTDHRWWGERAFRTNSDFYYNISAGTLTLWVK